MVNQFPVVQMGKKCTIVVRGICIITNVKRGGEFSFPTTRGFVPSKPPGVKLTTTMGAISRDGGRTMF
jgi:hypothetical protein